MSLTNKQTDVVQMFVSPDLSGVIVASISKEYKDCLRFTPETHWIYSYSFQKLHVRKNRLGSKDNANLSQLCKKDFDTVSVSTYSCYLNEIIEHNWTKDVCYFNSFKKISSCFSID